MFLSEIGRCFFFIAVVESHAKNHGLVLTLCLKSRYDPSSCIMVHTFIRIKEVKKTSIIQYLYAEKD